MRSPNRAALDRALAASALLALLTGCSVLHLGHADFPAVFQPAELLQLLEPLQFALR